MGYTGYSAATDPIAAEDARVLTQEEFYEPDFTKVVLGCHAEPT